MTASRQWTREELDRVHPLPDGWEWGLDVYGHPYARDTVGRTIEVDHGNLLALTPPSGDRFDPPGPVALAVILASQGLDSREAIADALAGFAGVSLQCEGDSPAGSEDAAVFGAQASAYMVAAAMLRRGRVEP
jgi:hypothetical protein